MTFRQAILMDFSVPSRFYFPIWLREKVSETEIVSCSPTKDEDIYLNDTKQ